MNNTVWAEVLGDPACPYMTRWVLDLGLFGLRLHHFHRSDNDRHLHDHPWWFVSLMLRGGYDDVTEGPAGRVSTPVRPGRVIFRPARHRHAVHLEPGRTCWTLVLSGPRRRVWGFWVDRVFTPAKDYFRRFDHPPCADRVRPGSR